MLLRLGAGDREGARAASSTCASPVATARLNADRRGSAKGTSTLDPGVAEVAECGFSGFAWASSTKATRCGLGGFEGAERVAWVSAGSNSGADARRGRKGRGTPEPVASASKESGVLLLQPTASASGTETVSNDIEVADGIARMSAANFETSDVSEASLAHSFSAPYASQPFPATSSVCDVPDGIGAVVL